jgi:hypothetical protein
MRHLLAIAVLSGRNKLDGLDHLGLIGGTINDFCTELHTLGAHLIDLIYDVFHWWTMEYYTLGTTTHGAEHGCETEPYHETDENGDPPVFHN